MDRARSWLICMRVAGTATLFCVLLCPVASLADDVFRPLDVRQVHVGGEIGRRLDVTVNNNLLVLDADKDFLAPFQKKTRKDGYIGLGKLIDAAVRLAAYTKSEKVIALKRRLVDETINAQTPDGYVGLMKPEARMWGAWDIHEMGYIIFGLTSDYHFFGEKRSLEAARKAADYIIERWSAMPANWYEKHGVAAHVLTTGLERAMLALHHDTKDQKYLTFVVRQRALPEWNLDIIQGRRFLIEGHAYGYLARCLAQLELYRLQPQESLLRPTQRAMRFLTAENGMVITGAAGQAEIWTDDQDGRNCLGETCTTAYQIRVFDSLLRLEGDSRCGDLMERTIYNTLFAAQSPDGRHIRYFTPLEGNREYHSGDSYCCPCNYRRIVADLPGMVYYRSDDGLAVNLYAPSEATLTVGDGVSVRVRQETDYPSSGRVVLYVEPSPSEAATFRLQLRIPRWCRSASLAVNDRPVDDSIVPGNFFAVERQWNHGDRVTLDMPMPWRLVAGRQRQAGRAAVMRGPMVFCLNPAQDKSLRDQDGADLGYITIDSESLEQVAGGDTVRPQGAACKVKASKKWYDVGVGGNLSLTLTEFADPDGKCVYFRLPDPNAAAPDELLFDSR